MLHKGFPVNKFLLHFNYMDVAVADKQGIKDIISWIRFAIDRQVEELKLQFNDKNHSFSQISPQCVFTSQFLVKLEFVNCKIEGLSRVQMGSLTKLSLKYVTVSNEMLKEIIDGCPSLQELVMICIYTLYVLQLTSPTIEKLGLDFFREYVIDCPNLKFLNIHAFRGINPQVFNIPSVREVHIQYIYRFDSIVNKIWKFEAVKFSNGAFPQTTLKELNFPDTRWKSLHTESQINPDQLIGICRLLRSSPHLKEFIVCSTSSKNTQQDLGETQSGHYLHYVELSSPCVIPQLKTVTMRGYEVSCQGLLLLAEFVLKSCVNLEKLVILHSTCSLVEDLKFLKQICNFPRASAKARVICGSEIY